MIWAAGFAGYGIISIVNDAFADVLAVAGRGYASELDSEG